MKHGARGFTLTELMVTLAVLAIILAFAVPSMTGVMEGQRVRNYSFDLNAALMYTRSEAVTRNATVVVSPVGGDWAQGWLVTVGGALLRQQDAANGISVTGAPAAGVTYGGDGRPTAANLSFQVQSTGGNSTEVRCLRISPSGRPESRTGVCS